MFLSGSGCVSIGTCYEYFVIFYLYSTFATPPKTLTTMDMEGLFVKSFCKHHAATTLIIFTTSAPCNYISSLYLSSKSNLNIFLEWIKYMHCFFWLWAIKISHSTNYIREHYSKDINIYFFVIIELNHYGAI